MHIKMQGVGIPQHLVLDTHTTIHAAMQSSHPGFVRGSETATSLYLSCLDVF